MLWGVIGVVALWSGVLTHPTLYKLNGNSVYEADLVPVSSTVIPLPIYQVSYGINVAPQKGTAIEKPLGPVTLVTATGKKEILDEKKKHQVSDKKKDP